MELQEYDARQHKCERFGRHQCRRCYRRCRRVGCKNEIEHDVDGEHDQPDSYEPALLTFCHERIAECCGR